MLTRLIPSMNKNIFFKQSKPRYIHVAKTGQSVKITTGN